MKQKIIKSVLVGLFLAATVLAVRTTSSSQKDTLPSPAQKKAAQVQAVPAVQGSISQYLNLTGTVQPYRTAQVASPAEGPVMNLHVWEGDRVQSGEMLLSIGRKKGIDALIEALHEDLKKEEDNLRRVEALVKADALAAEQLDTARSNFEKAKSQLVKAEETMGDFSIAAPWAGVVSHVKVKEGDFVAPRAPLIEIYDPHSLVVRVAVAEAFAAHIRNDMPIEVTLDAFPGSVFQARIVRLYPYLDPRMRTRTFEAKLIDPVELLPGMFARLKLQLAAAADAVIVPAEAVIVTPQGKRVVFIAQKGKAEMREVATGIEEGGKVQIIQGLLAGEAVIVTGNEKLADETAIQVQAGDLR